tara:strand:- start:12612 stop:13454 length:843 start_codon:yes stop_codon:yes gene_type:complete
MKNRELIHIFAKNISTILNGIANATKDQKGGNAEVTNIINTITNASLDIISNLSPTIEKLTTGEYAKMDPDEAASKIINTLKRQVKFYKAMSENPEVQEVLKEWAENVTEYTMQTSELMAPTIEQTVEKFWDMVNKTTIQSVTGSLTTAKNAGKAALSAVPVIGPATLLFITFIEGVSRGMKIALPQLRFGIDNLLTWTEKIKELIEISNNSFKKISDSSKKLQNILNTSVDDVLQSGITAGQTIGNSVTGGKRKQRKKKITATTRRLKKKISRFTRRTL